MRDRHGLSNDTLPRPSARRKVNNRRTTLRRRVPGGMIRQGSLDKLQFLHADAFVPGEIGPHAEMRTLSMALSRVELFARSSSTRQWIGQDVAIPKGVTIARGAIVGTKTVVDRAVPRNELRAGAPARMIRRNVSRLDPHLATDEQITDRLKDLDLGRWCGCCPSTTPTKRPIRRQFVAFKSHEAGKLGV